MRRGSGTVGALLTLRRYLCLTPLRDLIYRLTFRDPVSWSTRYEGKGESLVSVIITAHNQERYIECAIRSAAEQTYDQCEIVLIENGSRDRTREVVSRIAGERSFDGAKAAGRFVSRSYEAPLGVAGAFNAGLELASGKYVVILGGDDWLDPRFLELTVPVLDSDAGIGVVYTDSWIVGDKSGVVAKRRLYGPFSKTAFHLFNCIPTTALFRGQYVNRLDGVRFEPSQCDRHGNVTEYDDHMFWRKLIFGEKCLPFYIPYPLFYYRVHGSNETSRKLRKELTMGVLDRQRTRLSDCILNTTMTDAQMRGRTLQRVGQVPVYRPARRYVLPD